MRSSTRNNYYGIWKTFNEFFVKLDRKPLNWEDRIVLFAGYLAEQNRKSGTIRSYVSAIKAVQMDINIKVNEDRYLLSSITKGCRYENDRVKTRFPIHKKILNLLLDQLEVIWHDQPYLRILYQTMFSTAYYGLLRIGEITKGTHPILAKDVHIGLNKKKLMLVLHTSKTHWKNNKPQIIKISSNKQDYRKERTQYANIAQVPWRRCPYELLRLYSTMRRKYKDAAEPFFVFRDQTPVKPQQYIKVLKTSLKKAKLNPSVYSYSFRAGRSMDLLDMGVLVDTIKKLGRWKTVYIRT